MDLNTSTSVQAIDKYRGTVNQARLQAGERTTLLMVFKMDTHSTFDKKTSKDQIITKSKEGSTAQHKLRSFLRQQYNSAKIS
jgi:hypothetical protein